MRRRERSQNRDDTTKIADCGVCTAIVPWSCSPRARVCGGGAYANASHIQCATLAKIEQKRDDDRSMHFVRHTIAQGQNMRLNSNDY